MENRRADIIAGELEALIFTGELADGARLDEIKLAARFGVSRTPIREAFQWLINSGLVEQIPRRGVFVRHPNPMELMEMFEVMAELEASCARLAARRISDQALEQLKEANSKCRQAPEKVDTELYYAEHEVFHFLIYQECANRYLETETLRLHKRLQPYRLRQLKVRGRMAQSMEEHEAIVAALEMGDGDKAAEIIRSHITVQGERFRDLISAMIGNQAGTSVPS